MIKDEIKQIIQKAAGKGCPDFSVEIPVDKKHGDYSTNIAMVLGGKNPREVAEEIKSKIKSDLFSKIEIAGPGFINFFIADKVFLDNLKHIDKNFGKNAELKNQKIILDYTDANLFKEFHVGHLMSNAIGEALARIFEFQGAKVKRVCYQSDVGISVAKAVWGKRKKIELSWQDAYVFGSKMYEEDGEAKKEIVALNKKIFERSDKEVNKLYDAGKEWSLEHFDKIYKKLGTRFDELIFESYVSELGEKNVEQGLKRGVFEIGEKGAIVFKGEKYGLHTRVFINSEGLPTYEAKDLGLAEFKYKKYKYSKSIIVTANEQGDYFKVMLRAMSEVLPELSKKTKHIGHGMLRFAEGKMSSRTGNVITGESLINQVGEMVREKIKDRNFSETEKQEISEKVSVGAIKYSVLKQTIGHDIIFNPGRSISFEGDSGPYLQYAFARAISVLRKAKEEGVKPSFKNAPQEVSQLEKTMSYFPGIVSQAGQKYEPHYVLLYLTELAATFNAYYAENKIVDKKDEISPYRVAMTGAFAQIMENGLWLLGIQTLEKM